MITTAEEYNLNAWLFESQNVAIKAIQLPSDEVIYNINLENRSIDTPSFLGVTKEQGAETVYFLVDRFFGDIDLATTACFIQYENNNISDINERSGFYPVPFYDISTYSSLVLEEGYEEVAVNSGTYKPNKFYKKTEDGQYVLLTNAKYDETITEYYRLADPSDNRRYIVTHIKDESEYIKSEYYYIDPNTNEYVLDVGDYDPYVYKNVYNEETGKYDKVERLNKTYYKSMSKTVVKTNVDGNNYRINHYYVYNNTTKELELDKGPYVKDREYYTIIDKPKILFPWRIGEDVTKAAGPIQFSAWFYRVSNDGQDLVFSLHTRAANSKILDTLHVPISDDDFNSTMGDLVTGPSEYEEQMGEKPTVLQDLYYKIAMKNNVLYWEEA